MNIFRPGLPTDLDVKKLREHFPDDQLSAGVIVPYAKICALLDISEGSNRFQTVCSRWRKLLESESGIILKPVMGQKKYRVCDNADKADLSQQKSKSAARMAERSARIAGKVDRSALSDDQKRRFDASQQFVAAILGLSKVKRQALLPEI